MPSIIGADLKLVGNLICEGDIDIQGDVEGDIDAKAVTVDKEARIVGTVRARSLIVSGMVDGKLDAATISLTSTAQVTGDLVHETLSVDPGARLEARLSRMPMEKRIAAQIPKPKLQVPEAESPKAEPARIEPKIEPAKAEAESEREVAKAGHQTDSPKTGSGAEQEKPLRLENTEIPEAFDRRKKQAAG